MSKQKYICYEDLRKIAEETQLIVQQGFYRSSPLDEDNIYLDSEGARKHTVLRSSNDFLDFDCLHLQNYETKISVTNESTTAAIYRLSEEGHVKIAALNCASYRTAGGSWLKGAEAQEEHLAKCSDLVHCLQNCMGF
jgi:uncharacterized protein (TIGR02452 family)